MDLEEILHKLDEAKELEDWELVDECIESLRVLIDDFDEYQSEEDWGWQGFDRCYLKIKCSRDWVGLVTKNSPNSNGEESLHGLKVDWHLANSEMMFDTFVEPARTSQPTHVYA